jgi:hypothetical protein
MKLRREAFRAEEKPTKLLAPERCGVCRNGPDHAGAKRTGALRKGPSAKDPMENMVQEG